MINAIQVSAHMNRPYVRLPTFFTNTPNRHEFNTNAHMTSANSFGNEFQLVFSSSSRKIHYFADQLRSGQKRPATSPAPLIPTPSLSHHSHVSQMSNHASSHLVVGSTTPTGNSSNSSTRGPFASALRNLAKQADGKDEEVVDPRNPVAGSGAAVSATTASGGGGGGASNNVHLQHHGRQSGGTETRTTAEGKTRASPITDTRSAPDERTRKKTAISPAPPEKVCAYDIIVHCVQPM